MLRDLFEDLQLGQSWFQNSFFVVNKNGVTDYGKYKQALRELYTRYRALRDYAFEIRKLRLQIKKKERELSVVKDELEKEIILVEKRELELKLEETYRTLSQSKKEFIHFFEIAKHFKQLFGKLSEDDKDKLEQEFWMEKFKIMLSIDLSLHGKPSQGLLENLVSLPIEMQNKILDSPAIKKLQDSNKK